VRVSKRVRVRFSASEVPYKGTIGDGNDAMLPWLGWNVMVLLLLALAFCISYSVMKRWKANNMRVALVTFGGLPLFAWILGTVGWELDNELAVARAAFVYAVVLLPRRCSFSLLQLAARACLTTTQQTSIG
jgi:hypothetical protein